MIKARSEKGDFFSIKKQIEENVCGIKDDTLMVSNTLNKI